MSGREEVLRIIQSQSSRYNNTVIILSLFPLHRAIARGILPVLQPYVPGLDPGKQAKLERSLETLIKGKLLSLWQHRVL